MKATPRIDITPTGRLRIHLTAVQYRLIQLCLAVGESAAPVPDAIAPTLELSLNELQTVLNAMEITGVQFQPRVFDELSLALLTSVNKAIDGLEVAS